VRPLSPKLLGLKPEKPLTFWLSILVLGKQGKCMGGHFLNLILKLLYNAEDYRD